MLVHPVETVMPTAGRSGPLGADSPGTTRAARAKCHPAIGRNQMPQRSRQATWRPSAAARTYLGISETIYTFYDRRYLDFYNRRRPQSSLDGNTPDHAYFTPLLLRMAA
jgi:hypothetical protein